MGSKSTPTEYELVLEHKLTKPSQKESCPTAVDQPLFAASGPEDKPIASSPAELAAILCYSQRSDKEHTAVKSDNRDVGVASQSSPSGEASSAEWQPSRNRPSTKQTQKAIYAVGSPYRRKILEKTSRRAISYFRKSRGSEPQLAALCNTDNQGRRSVLNDNSKCQKQGRLSPRNIKHAQG